MVAGLLKIKCGRHLACLCIPYLDEMCCIIFIDNISSILTHFSKTLYLKLSYLQRREKCNYSFRGKTYKPISASESGRMSRLLLTFVLSHKAAKDCKLSNLAKSSLIVSKYSAIAI